ncbi:MAG: sugar phosphate isomerase/epimerase [Armatimonadetes bacterium]|nr:sugar phosphate isomerase/epimerase [Armatimonadota bacterium]
MSDRRAFLKGVSVAGAGVAMASAAGAATKVAVLDGTPAAALKMSSQQGIIPGGSLPEKLAKMEKWGYDGIELDAGIVGRVEEIQKALANSKLKVSAICAADGPYIVTDEAQRKRAMDNAKRILDAAGQLGSTGVIMVPAFNGAQGQLLAGEARKLLIDMLRELGAHAVQAKSRMLLEPLNRGEAYFLRQLGDAASICRDVDSPGIGLMGDFYHMRIEENSDMGAFISAGKYLHHVHLASWQRNQPGSDQRSFVDGFRGLKWIGYQDYCSLECGIKGDREVELPKIVTFLRGQWEEA